MRKTWRRGLPVAGTVNCYHLPYMVKTTVYLDEAVALRLKRMAQVQQRTQAELIRESLALLTESHSPQLPKGLGKFRSGETSNSETYRSRLRSAAKAGPWK